MSAFRIHAEQRRLEGKWRLSYPKTSFIDYGSGLGRKSGAKQADAVGSLKDPRLAVSLKREYSGHMQQAQAPINEDFLVLIDY